MNYSIIKDRAGKINLYIAYLIVLIIPSFIKYIPPLIILWVITWVLEGNFKNRFKRNINKSKKIYLGLFLSYFFFILIGVLYSANIDRALFDVEQKLSFLIFPLFFAGVNELYYKNKDNFLKLFILGNLSASVICIIIAFYNSVTFSDGKIVFDMIMPDYKALSLIDSIKYGGVYFSYTSFSFFHHTTYFSAYLCLSIIFIFHFINYKKFDNKKVRTLFIILIIFFFIILFMLSSKAGILTSLFILLSKLIQIIYKSSNKILRIVAVAFIVLVVILVINNPRLKNAVEKFNSYNQENIEVKSQNRRLIVWKNAFEVFKENSLFGAGTGDGKKELHKKIEENEDDREDVVNLMLNCHNQYLETLIHHGLLGLIILLSLFIYPLFFLKGENRKLFLWLSFILAFNFLFESVLNLFGGVIFFAFFMNFFVFVYSEKENKKRGMV